MKVSIITATYNSAKTVKDTIESVLQQDYPDIEYIIIDGVSKDETLDIARGYGTKISKIISEPDKGIYDAMNKGVQHATGDIVAILNSDDFYTGPTVISAVVSKFKETRADAVIAGSYHVAAGDDNKIVQIIRTPLSGKYIMKGNRVTDITYKEAMIYHGWVPPHTSLFVSKATYEKYGLFNMDYKVSADVELMFRFFVVHEASLAFLDKFTVKMREGGASTNSLKQRISNVMYGVKIAKNYGYSVGAMYVIRRISSKIKQRLKAQ